MVLKDQKRETKSGVIYDIENIVGTIFHENNKPNILLFLKYFPSSDLDIRRMNYKLKFSI